MAKNVARKRQTARKTIKKVKSTPAKKTDSTHKLTPFVLTGSAASPTANPAQNNQAVLDQKSQESNQSKIIKDETHKHPDDEDLNKKLNLALKAHDIATTPDPNAPKRPEIGLDGGNKKQDLPANYILNNTANTSTSTVSGAAEKNGSVMPQITWFNQDQTKKKDSDQTPNPTSQSADNQDSPVQINKLIADEKTINNGLNIAGTASDLNPHEDHTKKDSEDLAKLIEDNAQLAKVEQDEPLNLNVQEQTKVSPPPLQDVAEREPDKSKGVDMSSVLLSYASQNYNDTSSGFSLSSTKFAFIMTYFAGVVTASLIAGFLFNYNGGLILGLRSNHSDIAGSTPLSYASETKLPSRKNLIKKATSSAQLSNQINRKDIKLKILNGSMMKNAAASAAAKLKSLGYDIVGTGNALNSNYLYTQVMTKSSDASISAELVNDLAPQLHASTSADLPTIFAADAEIIIGKN